jgi:UDP-glucose 4-epimerase
MAKLCVTGGAGFIGSHLTDALVAKGHEVLVIDTLSSGRKDYVNPKATLARKDIRSDLSKELKEVDAVFHFAADPDVRTSATDPRRSFDANVVGTFMVLESCRKADVRRVVFPSTSTVYGETGVIPTSEDEPCFPISNYGASKLACEAYLSSYSASYGMKCTSLRFANIFGERSTHGVLFDFYNKLKKNAKEMEILGDGKQDKSYLHVSDCVFAAITAWEKQERLYDVFNVGSREKKTVTEIARILCDELGVSPRFMYTGTSRGWVGDMRLMLLDTGKLERLGWKQSVSFAEGMRKYVKWIRSEEGR